MSLIVQAPAFVTGAAAITLTVGKNGLAAAYAAANGRAFAILGVYVHLDIAPVSAGSVIVTAMPSYGTTEYDTVMVSDSLVGLTDWYWAPAKPVVLSAMDDVNVAYANPDGSTVGVTVQWAQANGGV